MERPQGQAQEILWLSGELRREVNTLANTPYPYIHTFLAKNILHAIEKEVAGMRQVLVSSEQKEKAS